MNILLPKTSPVITYAEQKIFFLAGPIRGADDWHQKMAELIWEKSPEALVVIPLRYEKSHPFFDNNIGGERDEEKYPSQTKWEREWMKKASHSHQGAIIFWLPCESKTNPRKKEDGPYAQDTYGELGAWRIEKKNRGNSPAYCSVFFGAEILFPGLPVIKKNMIADLGHDPFCDKNGYHTNTPEKLVDKIFKADGSINRW